MCFITIETHGCGILVLNITVLLFWCVSGYYCGGLNSSSAGMYVNVMDGVRGPFTASQWVELEQQALIYKYITANEPIPAHLLTPIKKALQSAALFAFSTGGGTLRPTACKT